MYHNRRTICVTLPALFILALSGKLPVFGDQALYALHEAVMQRDAAAMLRQLEDRPDLVNRPGQGAWRALHLAVALDWPEGVALLLEHGADVHSGDRYGWTPLHLAAARGYTAVAELLLVAGAEPGARDERGALTPLHRAGLNGQPDVVRLLLQFGAEADARSQGAFAGMTPLHWAAGGASEGNTHATALLLEAGANASGTDSAGMTALHWAVLSARPDTVALLLASGAPTDVRDDRGESATDYAARASKEIQNMFFRQEDRLPLDGWRFHLDPEDRGRQEGWFRPDLDEQAWDTIAIGQHWQDAGYEYYGAAWYRRSFEAPAKPFEQAEFYFFAVDGDVSVWLNGEYIGTDKLRPRQWNEPFSMPITRHLRAGEENHLTLRVEKYSGKAGVWLPIELKLE